MFRHYVITGSWQPQVWIALVNLLGDWRELERVNANTQLTSEFYKDMYL